MELKRLGKRLLCLTVGWRRGRPRKPPDDVTSFLRAAGIELTPWQRRILDQILAGHQVKEGRIAP